METSDDLTQRLFPDFCRWTESNGHWRASSWAVKSCLAVFMNKCLVAPTGKVFKRTDQITQTGRFLSWQRMWHHSFTTRPLRFVHAAIFWLWRAQTVKCWVSDRLRTASRSEASVCEKYLTPHSLFFLIGEGFRFKCVVTSSHTRSRTRKHTLGPVPVMSAL